MSPAKSSKKPAKKTATKATKAKDEGLETGHKMDEQPEWRTDSQGVAEEE